MAARSGICKRFLTRHLRKLLSTCGRQGQINGNLMRINNSSKAEQTSHKPAQIPLAPPSSSSEAKDLGGAFALLLRFASCFRDGFFTSQKFDSGNSPRCGELPSLRMTLGGYSPRRLCRGSSLLSGLSGTQNIASASRLLICAYTWFAFTLTRRKSAYRVALRRLCKGSSLLSGLSGTQNPYLRQ